MDHIAMDGEGKRQGDQEPIQTWKEHYEENRLMHQKIDLIAAKIGLKLYNPNLQMEEVGCTSQSKNHSRLAEKVEDSKGMKEAQKGKNIKMASAGDEDHGHVPI